MVSSDKVNTQEQSTIASSDKVNTQEQSTTLVDIKDIPGEKQDQATMDAILDPKNQDAPTADRITKVDTVKNQMGMEVGTAK